MAEFTASEGSEKPPPVSSRVRLDYGPRLSYRVRAVESDRRASQRKNRRRGHSSSTRMRWRMVSRTRGRCLVARSKENDTKRTTSADLFHALELYLKALLLEKHSDGTLTDKLGHNIKRLVQEAEALGLVVAD
jgi:hypothetical protein